jgi:hypothetical protein
MVRFLKVVRVGLVLASVALLASAMLSWRDADRLSRRASDLAAGASGVDEGLVAFNFDQANIAAYIRSNGVIGDPGRPTSDTPLSGMVNSVGKTVQATTSAFGRRSREAETAAADLRSGYEAWVKASTQQMDLVASGGRIPVTESVPNMKGLGLYPEASLARLAGLYTTAARTVSDELAAASKRAAALLAVAALALGAASLLNLSGRLRKVDAK